MKRKILQEQINRMNIFRSNRNQNQQQNKPKTQTALCSFNIDFSGTGDPDYTQRFIFYPSFNSHSTAEATNLIMTIRPNQGTIATPLTDVKKFIKTAKENAEKTAAEHSEWELQTLREEEEKMEKEQEQYKLKLQKNQKGKHQQKHEQQTSSSSTDQDDTNNPGTDNDTQQKIHNHQQRLRLRPIEIKFPAEIMTKDSKNKVKYRQLLDHHHPLANAGGAGMSSLRGQTAVLMCCSCSNPNTIDEYVKALEFLLQAGCSPNIRDSSYQNVSPIEKILSSWPAATGTAAASRLLAGKTQMIQLLLDYGASVTNTNLSTYNTQRNCFHTVAEKGITSLLPLFFDARRSDNENENDNQQQQDFLLWGQDKNGETAMMLAISQRRKEMAMNLWEAMKQKKNKNGTKASGEDNGDNDASRRPTIDERIFFVRNKKGDSVVDLASRFCVTGPSAQRQAFQFIKEYADKKKNEARKIVEEVELGNLFSSLTDDDGFDGEPLLAKKVVTPKVNKFIDDVVKMLENYLVEKSRRGEAVSVQSIDDECIKHGKCETARILREKYTSLLDASKIVAFLHAKTSGNAQVTRSTKRRMSMSQVFLDRRNSAPLYYAFGVWIAYILTRNMLASSSSSSSMSGFGSTIVNYLIKKLL